MSTAADTFFFHSKPIVFSGIIADLQLWGRTSSPINLYKAILGSQSRWLRYSFGMPGLNSLYCYVFPADMNFSLSLTATNVSWIFVAFGLKGYTKTSCSFCLNSTHAHTFIRSEKGRTTSIIYTWSVSVCQYVLEYFPNWKSQCSPWSLNKIRNYFDNFTAAEYKCLSSVLLLQITD